MRKTFHVAIATLVVLFTAVSALGTTMTARAPDPPCLARLDGAYINVVTNSRNTRAKTCSARRLEREVPHRALRRVGRLF